jgi:LysR family nitrogen assimilation transcriptional regulator
MINIRKISYFIKVADCGSLSRAAAELAVSQPTISQQISALETHLCHRLFIRSGSGVTVTDAGRVFYRHAQALAKQIAAAENDVRSVDILGAGQLSLGLATCGAASTLALPILERLREERPEFRLRINDNFVGTLSDFIMTGRIDLALAYTVPPIRGLRSQGLFTEELFAIRAHAADAPLSQGPVIDLSVLESSPMVLTSDIHVIRNTFERACLRAGFRPHVVAEIDSLPTMLEAVRSGLGTTILPLAALAAGERGLIAHRIGPEPLEAAVSLCTSARLPMTASIEAIGTMIKDLVWRRLQTGAWPGVRPSLT